MAYKYPQVTYNQQRSSHGDPRRTHQIEELLMVFPNVKAIGDRSILECPFHLRDGRLIHLRILLPAVFPEHPPRFVLTEDLENALVDSSHNVNLPMLSEWKPQYRLVDALLQAQELLSSSAGPPLPATSTVQPQPAPPPSRSSQGSNSPSDTHGDTVTQFLQRFSDEELFRFLTDETGYKQLVSIVAAELKIVDRYMSLEEMNVQLAKENLERESEIQDRKNQVAIVRSSDYANTRTLYETATKEHQELNHLVNIPGMLQQLQETAKTLQDESENLALSALQGEMPPGDFIDAYLKLRREHYEKDLLAKSAARLA